jgi:hypothetical protein
MAGQRIVGNPVDQRRLRALSSSQYQRPRVSLEVDDEIERGMPFSSASSSVGFSGEFEFGIQQDFAFLDS